MRFTAPLNAIVRLPKMSRTSTKTLVLLLALDEAQANTLRTLRDSAKNDALSSPFVLANKFGVARAMVFLGENFSLHGTYVKAAGIGKLPTTAPIKRTGPGFKKQYLCLIEKPSGWNACIALARRSPKRDRSKKNERVYSDAAIFITDKVVSHKVSGGLPSLGKRR